MVRKLELPICALDSRAQSLPAAARRDGNHRVARHGGQACRSRQACRRSKWKVRLEIIFRSAAVSNQFLREFWAVLVRQDRQI